MIITKELVETIEEFKRRLVEEVELGNLSAEDAFDAYEEAVQKEAI